MNEINEEQKLLSKNRRKVITAGATGVVAGAVWHKPVINSVITPAHAQTTTGGSDDSGSSDTDIPVGTTYFLEGGDGDLLRGSFNPLNLLIDEAYAGNDQPGSDGWILMEYLGGDEFSYEHLNENTVVRRRGTVALDDVGVMEIVEDCREEFDFDGGNNSDHFVQILAADEDSVTISINDGGVFFVPAGTGVMPVCGAGQIERIVIDEGDVGR